MKIYDFNGKKNISGERIREARIKMHLSQKALAVRLKLEGVELEKETVSVELRSALALLLIMR